MFYSFDMFYDIVGNAQYKSAGLHRAFNDAYADGACLLAIMRIYDGQRYIEEAVNASSEEELLRYIRYEGLRPGGKPQQIIKLFDLTHNFETQLAMTSDKMLIENLSAAAQKSYSRYLEECTRAKSTTPIKRRPFAK